MKLTGKKTYIVAIGTVLGAVGGFLTGALSLPEAIQLAITGVMGATVRSGVSTEVAKVQ